MTKVACLGILLSFSINSFSQCPTLFVDDMNGTPGYPELNDLSVCGLADTISFYVLNTSGQTLLNSEMTLNIPPGMQYGGCVEAFDPAYNIMEGDISDLQNPSFIFASIGADSVQILTICIIANCDIYDLASDSQFKFGAEFNFLYLENGAPKPIQCMATHNGTVDYSPFIKRPTINITNVTNSTMVLTNSNQKCSNITVSQTGIGASVAGFNFEIYNADLTNFGITSVTIGGAALPYTYDSGTMTVAAFVDGSFLPGGALLEDESVVVRVCWDAPLICDTDQSNYNLQYAASFGCSPDEPPCIDPSTWDASLQYAPNFGANADVDITQVSAPGICGADAVFDAVVKSTNTDPLLGLWEEVKLGFQICEGDAFEPSEVLINGVALDPSSYYYDNFDFVVDATTFTSDPDGPGVGFEDVDGDGTYDDLPGGNEAVLTIAVKIKCQDPAAIAGCASLDCTFNQATITGLRHCSQEFQVTPSISPAPTFSYGSEYININETDISPNMDGSINGFDFGMGTGTDDTDASLNTVDMEFCYLYKAEGIDACSAPGDMPYFEVQVGGPPIVVGDMVINPSSVMFQNAPVAPGLISSSFNADSSSVVYRIDIGNNDTTTEQCYNFTLELDSCLCYPLQYLAASMRVVETCSDCMGPDGNDCTLVRACDDTQLASKRSCNCVCPMSSEIVEMRRVEYGYDDKAMTNKLEYDSPEVDPLDWNRYLPCDSMYMHIEYEVIDPLTMADLDEIYFRLYNYAANGTWSHRPTYELEPDMHHSRMLEFSYEKVSGGGRNMIDFNACNDNKAAEYRNINDGYFDSKGAGPATVINGVSTFNSSGDVFDNREFTIRIIDADRQKDRGLGGNRAGDCWTDILENQMGGLEKGDKFHMIVHIPFQKNPFRQLIPDIAATPPSPIVWRGDAYWYAVVGGKRTYQRGTCTGTRIIETACPGPIVSDTEYTITDCGAEVEHSFEMTNTPGDWYVNEFRPDIMEMDTLKVPIPSPFVYAGNPRIMLPDGTVIPISDPMFDNNTFCAYDAAAGQTKCTSITGSTGYMMFDVSELPTFGVGLPNDPACSYKLLYDLERICPGPVTAPEDFQILYDYSYSCEYNPGGQYCNNTNYPWPIASGGTPIYSFLGNQMVYPVEDCPGDGSANANQLRFTMRDYHLTEDTSFTLTFNDTSNPLPPLSSTLSNSLLADATGASEFNTYEFCADNVAGGIAHSNVMTTIFLEPTVDLINVTDGAGNPVTFTLTNTSSLGSTYLIELGADLNPGDCDSYIIETELKICPYPGVGTNVIVKTTSSCLDLDFASQLFGVGGEACIATGQQYEYIAGEAEIQAAWLPQDNPSALCGINDHQVEIKNTKDATLVDLLFNFNFPAGLIVIPGTFEYEYPAGSGTWLPISDPTASGTNAFGTVMTIDDNDMVANIDPNGLPGILDPGLNANRLYIRFQSRTICDEYVSTTPIYFETTAATPCEERISSGFSQNPGIIVNNAIPNESAQFLIVADPLDYKCGGPVPLTIAGTNLSQTGGVTMMSEACFKFPPNLVYTPGSFMFNSPSYWTPTYVNETALPGGYTELCFDLPDGMAPLEGFGFTAEVTPSTDVACQELQIGALVKSLIEDQVCVGDDNTEGTGDDSTCDVFVNNSINDQIIVNIKPPVELADLELIVNCDDDPTMATFDYTVTLETTTNMDYVGPMTLEFYRDLNLNGVFDPGVDPLMDTQSQTVNVTAGTPTEVSGMTTLPEEFSCPIIINTMFDSGCDCSGESYYFDAPPTPDFVADFDGPVNLCPGDDFTIEICAGYDFELENPASGSMTDDGSTLGVTVNAGYGINSPVVLKVMSMGPCGGEFEIEIYQLETFEIGPFAAVDACDMECTTLVLDGVPDDWQGNMTVEWSPATYLSDPTSWEPEICDPAADITYTVTVTNPNTGCVTSADYNINVINTDPPTLTYDGFDECYFAYDPPKIIAEPTGFLNYAFYYVDPAGDILLQTGASNEFILPFPSGEFYVLVDDGECMIPSAPITVDLKQCVFDMALKKVLSPSQVVPVYAGDKVTFDITVYNQGTEVAQDIIVSDYIPAGFVLNDPNWFSVSATEANITIAGPMLPGDSVTISIMLDVTNAALVGDVANYAEITSADDIGSQGYPDIDSTPDNDDSNDTGGTPDDPNEDNVVSDDGTIDEDDHDPASVPVEIFDLALTKMLSPTQPVPVQVGDDVTYDIEVCNQGTVDAFNVEVVDYIPAGLTLNDPTWILDANGNAYQTITGPIAAGTCQTITLVCTISAFPASGSYQNYAEISSAEDGNGNMPDDIDSTPDDDDGNDGPVSDDTTDGSNGDEDDHDPAVIPVVQTECNISNNGPACDGDDVTLTEDGGDAVSWAWTGPAGFTSALQNPVVSPAIGGVYEVIITDQFGFMDTCFMQVDVIPDVTINGNITDASCNAGSDGEIDIIVVGGTGPFEFDWDIDGFEAINDDFEDQTGLTAGTYNVEVTDVNGCVSTAMFTINEPDAVTCIAVGTDALCNGAADGIITVTAMGGNSPYEYSFDGAAYQPGNSSSGFAAGTYTVTVRDSDGCTSTCDVTIAEPTPLVCTLVGVDETDCDVQNGEATVTATGGTIPYMYSIDGGAAQASDMFTGLDEGLHTVTVTDANGCETTCDVTILAPAFPECTVDAITDVSCNGDADGEVTVSGSAGSGSFEYSIDGGTTFQASGTFSNLAAGTYTIITRNTGTIGCIVTCEAIVAEPEILECVEMITTESCAGGDGSIEAIISGGTEPFEYSIDGGMVYQTGNIFSGLVPGSYTVMTRDANGCIITCEGEIVSTCFDLALVKVIDPNQPTPVTPGDNVTFFITVYNQGAVDAYNVEVVDYTPSGMILNDPAWSVGAAPDEAFQTIPGPIVPGDSVVLSIILQVDPNYSGGSLQNFAEISSADDDTDPNNDPPTDGDSNPDNDNGNDGDYTDDDTDNTNGDEDDHDPADVFVQVFDLALEKDIAASQVLPIAPGDMITFTLTVTNQGNVDAYNIGLSDNIPVGTTLADPNWTDNGGVADLNALIAGPLAPGASTTVDITFLIDANFMGSSIMNSAQISEADDDTDPDNDPPEDTDSDPDNDDGDQSEDDEDPETVPIGQVFDLALIKTIDPNQPMPINPGDDITYLITVYNQGTLDAYNIEVVDYIPTGMLLNDPTWAAGSAPNTAYQTVAGPLMPGDSSVLTLVLQVDPNYSGGSLQNFSEISEADDDTDPNNDPPTDVDSEPDDDDSNDGDYTDNDTDNTDGDEDDHDPEEVFIQVFDLALEKDLSTAQTLPIGPGDQITFTLTVTNEGNVDAYSIGLADVIPPGTTLDDTDWTDNGGVADLNIAIPGPLAPGASTTVDITFLIDSDFMGTSIMNSAEISEADDDTDPDNDPPTDNDSDPDNDDGDQSEDDEDSEETPIGQVFDLALVKVIDPNQPTPVTPGDDVTFFITVYNQGTLDAYNVEVVDYTPSGMILNDPAWSIGAAPDEAFQTVPGPIMPGDSVVLSIILQVDPNYSGGSLQNFAEISAADDDTDPNNDPPTDVDSDPDDDNGNDGDFTDGATDGTDGDEDDHDPADVFVQVFDLSLIKTVSATQAFPIAAGDDVTFTLTVTNQGNVDAYSINLVDYIPVDLILNDSDWTEGPAGEAHLNVAIPGPLAPGSTSTVDITFTVDPSFMGSSITNYSEISGADDDTDPSNDPPEDVDSDPDSDANNDGPSEDNVDDNTNDDEDDHDPETIPIGQVFDLALTKILDPAQPLPVEIGDIVTFIIEVTNQGTLDAYNIEVVDYIPTGFILVDPAWSPGSLPNEAYQTITGPLAAGASQQLTIMLEVDPSIAGGTTQNFAEISSADDDTDPDNDPPTDVDSDPDNDQGNDGDYTDDDTDNTDGDEDDHDPADVFVQIFDLALDKAVAPTQPLPIAQGDLITFTLTVTNEGNVDAFNIGLSDVIPVGTTLADVDWTDNSGIADLNTLIPGPLAPGASTTVNITFQIDADFMGSSIMNAAQISEADDDTDPDNDPPTDVDSDPDNDDGDQSEDDEDPETVPIGQVFDLALVKMLDPSTPLPVTPGDDVTFSITVYNQGTLDAYNVEVVDYTPSGMILNDPSWSIGAAPDEAFQTVPGPIVPGDSVVLTIVLQVDPNYTGGSLQNFAEISEAQMMIQTIQMEMKMIMIQPMYLYRYLTLH